MKTPPLQVSIETVTSIREMLTALPPKPKTTFTARETVHAVADDIRAAIELGYSLSDIAERFAANGMKITAGTLASYLRELKMTVRKVTRNAERVPEAMAPDGTDTNSANDERNASPMQAQPLAH